MKKYKHLELNIRITMNIFHFSFFRLLFSDICLTDRIGQYWPIKDIQLSAYVVQRIVKLLKFLPPSQLYLSQKVFDNHIGGSIAKKDLCSVYTSVSINNYISRVPPHSDCATFSHQSLFWNHLNFSAALYWLQPPIFPLFV